MTPGYTFANFWFSPGLGWRGPGRTPLPKNKSRALPPPRGGGGGGGGTYFWVGGDGPPPAPQTRGETNNLKF